MVEKDIRVLKKDIYAVKTETCVVEKNICMVEKDIRVVENLICVVKREKVVVFVHSQTPLKKLYQRITQVRLEIPDRTEMAASPNRSLCLQFQA